jgi:N-acetylmuramoyl-L-alanine amidase
MLRTVLLSLSQSATQHASLSAASKVYEQLGRVGKTHGRRVQQARFVVLKSPDIPSILVETGFISNPGEETSLRNPAHQENIAKAVTRGVKQFFIEAPPPGTLLAEQRKVPRKHVIAKGDTLSEIADRYQVSLVQLRRTNAIRSDNLIRIGQVLLIPET